MRVNEETLLEYIKTSHFVENNFKNNLIKYFEKLDSEKILLLVKYLDNQRHDVLTFLKKLKDVEGCSFEEIKTNIYNKTRMKIIHEEKQELKNEENEFLCLVNSIDNL